MGWGFVSFDEEGTVAQDVVDDVELMLFFWL
jgi:hypothetical protein